MTFLHDLHVLLVTLFGPGTWGAGGNIAAAPILAACAGLAAYLGRHRIGKGLAAWWDKHHGPKAVERHKQALREHEAAKREGGAP